MAITLNGFWSAQEKTSDTTMPSVPTGATVVNVLPGDTLFAFFAFDNLTNTTPTITGVSRTSGSLNLASVWTRISEFNSPQAAAAGGVRGELWRANITTAVGAGTVDMIGSLSAAVTAKAALLLHFSGVGVLDSMGTSTGANIADSAVAGDLLIAFNGTESNVSQAFSGVNVGGFTAVTANGTTGGSGVTNVWANSTYQIATGALSPQVGAAVTDGGVIFGVFKPTPDPVLTQAAYQFYEDGTESGSTALAAQNTAPTVDTSGGDVNLGLRVRVQETGTALVPATSDFQLQYDKNASDVWVDIPSLELFTSYPLVNRDAGLSLGGTTSQVSQQILGTGSTVVRAGFRLQRMATPDGTIGLAIRASSAGFGVAGAVPTGPDLAVSVTSVATTTIGVTEAWYYFDFSGFVLTSGTPYFLVLTTTNSVSSSILVGTDISADTYPGVHASMTSSVWTAYTTRALIFEAYSVGPVAPYDSANLNEPALADQYAVSNADATDSMYSGNGVRERAQSFLGDGKSLRRVGFYLSKTGAPTNVLSAKLYAHSGTFGSGGLPTGPALATSTTVINGADLSTTAAMVYFDFDTSVILESGTPYFVALAGGTADAANTVNVAADSTSPSHPGNAANYAAVWTTSGSRETIFEVYTSTSTTTSRLTGGTGSFVAGKISEDGLVDDLGWAQGNHTELVYSLTLIAADLAPSDTLRFRVLRNGAVLNTYAQVPTLSIASAGPQVRQVSGIVPVTVGVSGDVTRVPLTLQVSGSVVVTTAASGAATIVAGPVTHQVSGIVAVTTAASGAATVYVPPVTHQVSGTVPVVSDASGAVSLRQPVSGTVAVTTGASGVATGGQGQPPGWEQGAYPVMVRTTVSGAVTVVAGAVTHQVSGVVPVNVGAAGTVSARLQASGSIPVVTTAVGAATRVPINQQVSGSVPVVTTTTGAATRVPIVHQVSGTVPVVTAVVGDATRVPITFPVAGTVPVVTVATGSPILVGGAQQYQVSGTVPVITTVVGDATRVPIVHQVSGTVPVSTAASGVVTARLSASGVVPVVTTAAGTISSLLPTSGTVPVATAVSGAVTVSPKPVSGTVAVVTTVNGAVSAQLPVSGTAAVVTTAAGSVSQSLSVSGTVAVVTSASGAISKQQQVSGVVPVNTAASGAVSSRLPVSGVAPVTVSAVGAVTSKQNVSGVVPVVTGTVGNALPPGGTSGTVAVTVGVTGAVTSKQGVAGSPAAVTVGVSGAVTSKQGVTGIVPVTTGVSGAVQINPRGRVDVVTGVSGTVTQVHQVSGSVAVSTGASGVVSAKFPVAGTVPVVTTASGSANFVGGAVTHPVSGTVAVVTTTSGTISAVKPTSGTVAVVTASSGSIARIQSVSGTVAVVTGTSGAATISVKQLQVSGRVDVTTAANGSITAVLRVSGTVVVVTDASGKTLSPGLPPFPCGDLVLTPSGPKMSLVGATPVLTLQMEVDRLPLSGAAEGYPVTKTAERLTLEGVC